MSARDGEAEMSERKDVIVVGGGHNGLVCGAYLARAGRRVLVLEANAVIGGGAVNKEIAPGFTLPACAHILHHLHPRVISELNLAGHGLSLAATDLATIALGRDGRHLVLHGGEVTPSLKQLSAADAAALPGFHARMSRFAEALRPLLTEAPPRLHGMNRGDRWTLAKLAWRLRRLGRVEFREFLRVAAMNAADILEESFESDLLKGALAFDAVLGTSFGPRSPGSVFTLLYRLAGQVEGRSGALALPRGGMGAAVEAIAAAARAQGAEIRTEARVARILVEDDRAAGVELQSGERIAAGTVVSNADPKATFLSLLGAEHLDTGFVRRISNLRMNGMAAKLHLVLDGLPNVPGLSAAELGERLVIAPGIDALERAFNHTKYGAYSESPAMEVTIPSVADPSLAPEGRHVLSAVVLYAPYHLKQGWEAARDTFAELAIETLAAYAPDLPERIVARELVTPVDLERDFGMTGGHWHHGDLALDQMLMLRPVPGASRYAAPLPGLYLCGAGSHPGGGVMGAAGFNAAQRILGDGGAA
jgi:phytoene dehydrogenase-like protein